jgi:hypothetical protein
MGRFSVENDDDRDFTIELHGDRLIKPLPDESTAMPFEFEPLSPVAATESERVPKAEVVPFGALIAHLKSSAICQGHIYTIIPMIVQELGEHT